MKSGKLLISFIILVWFGSPAFSQDQTCEQTLNQASAEFDAGRFYSLPALLKNCLDKGFTSEQKFRAYYLLAQAYAVLDDPIAAENSYLGLLKINPEFKPSIKNDPIDLVYLSRKFTSRPRFTPHARLGANVSFPRSLAGISTYSKEVSSSKGVRVGLQVGVGLDWNISDKWSLCGEANFVTKSFSIFTEGIAVRDNSLLIEKSNWIDLPIYLKYSYDSGRFRPFGYVGFAFNALLSSNSSHEYNDISKSGTEGQITRIAQGPDISLNNSRNFLNYSALLGGGLKYKFGKDFIYADVRYMIGLNNLVNPSTNFYNSEGTLATTITQYQYVSDFYRLDNLSLSFGYVKPLYNPRKIKKVNTKGFFRNLIKPRGKKG